MRIALFVLSFLSVVSLAQAGGKLRAIDYTATFLENITREKGIYHLPTTSNLQIPVTAEFYDFENGELAMSGKALESDSSMFILKGDKKEVYGWVALRAKNIAYEYTTDNTGMVVAEEVPVSRVIAEDDFIIPEGACIPAADTFPFKTIPPLPHIGPYKDQSLLKLESVPGCDKIIYMNITACMNGETPKSMSKEEMWKAWCIIAAGYSWMNINVTTSTEVFAKVGQKNAGIVREINSDGRSSSPVGVFGTGQSSSCYITQSPYKGGFTTGRIALHESGHMMGTLDYGQGSSTYFGGFPEFKWTPIMGNMWPANNWGRDGLMQWSKGEYTGANVKTDALAVYSKIKPYRADDIPDKKPITIIGTTVDADKNYGQICPNTDTDSWTFKIKEKGHAKLLIDRIERLGGAMLDVDASIVDASGKVMVQHNAPVARFAQLDVDLPAGDYTLIVKGGAEGTPQKGFSTYGSMGFYAMEGEITGAATEIGPTPFEAVNAYTRIQPITKAGIVTIEYPKNSTVRDVSVLSLKGAVVFNAHNAVNTIDLSKVAAGMYMLHLNVDGVKLARKIIKN